MEMCFHNFGGTLYKSLCALISCILWFQNSFIQSEVVNLQQNTSPFSPCHPLNYNECDLAITLFIFGNLVPFGSNVIGDEYLENLNSDQVSRLGLSLAAHFVWESCKFKS